MTTQTFWNWFYNSSSILWSRFQVLAGCIMLVITTTDMSQWIPIKYMALWTVISNVVAEYLRRTNTQEDTIQVVDKQLGVMSEVTYLKPPDPVPDGAKLVQVKSSKAGGSRFGIIGISFALTAIIFMVVVTFMK